MKGFAIWSSLSIWMVFLAVTSVVGGDVVELKTMDFNAVTSSGNHLVAIYSPKCGACATFMDNVLKPSLDELEGLGYKVSKVNGDVERLFLVRYNLKKFPSVIKIVPGQQSVLYKGDAAKKQFMEFAKTGAHEEEINRESMLADGRLVWALPGVILACLNLVHSFIVDLDVPEPVRNAIGMVIGFLIPLSLLPFIMAGMLIYARILDAHAQKNVKKTTIKEKKKQ